MDGFKNDKEFLETAQAALAAETEEMFKVSSRLNENIVKAMKLIWHQLIVVWAVVLVLVLGYFLALLKTSPSGQEALSSGLSSTTIASPQVPPSAKPDEANALPGWEETRGILEQIREAQLKKNINQFFQAYSPTFPNLNQKRENLLKSWKNYDLT